MNLLPLNLAHVAKRLLVPILLVTTLISCRTATEIHLFTNAESSNEIEAISSQLLEAGFRVSASEREIPGNMRRTTILYPPIIRDVTVLETLQGILAGFAYSDINVTNLSMGNHFYSTDNIGVYLLGKDESKLLQRQAVTVEEQLESPSKLSQIYYSTCSKKADVQLSLYGNGAMLLEVFGWDELADVETSTFFDGDWNESNGDLTLSLYESETLRYSVAQLRERTAYGLYTGTVLKSETPSSIVQDCDFIYRVRSRQ